MRGGIDGTAARRQGAAVKERLTFVVDRLELHPDVERIDGAAREEMSDLARADDDVETQRFAAAHGCRDAIDRRDHVGGRRERRSRGAEVHRLFADGERAREARLGGCDGAIAGAAFRHAREAEDVH